METRALALARASELIEPGGELLVLVSGGADSTCLLDVAVTTGARVEALHVNYGLRPEADADERHCRALCERLGVALRVERVTLAPGNLQAAAREARYAIADRLARGDYATAHTATDQAETVLYRLVTSPGRRALIGMKPRRARLVRPLLKATRADTRAHCRAAGFDWREDSANADPRFARTRLRREVLPVLEQIAPAAVETIAATSRALDDESRLLATLVVEALERVGTEPRLDALRSLDPTLRRLVVRELAERAGARALTAEAVERILALEARGGSLALDIGGGVRAVVEYGRLRFARAREKPPPQAATLPIPGSVAFGAYELRAAPAGVELDAAAAGPATAQVAVALDAAALGREALVRSWTAGDRMRPAGLGGTRKLQDLFTDRKVPRAERHSIPLVVAADGEIAWVPGVAVGERFRPRPPRPVVALSAARAPDGSRTSVTVARDGDVARRDSG